MMGHFDSRMPPHPPSARPQAERSRVVLHGDDGNPYGAGPLQTTDELDSVEWRRNARLNS